MKATHLSIEAGHATCGNVNKNVSR